MKKIVNMGILLLVLIAFSGVASAAPPHKTTRDMYGYTSANHQTAPLGYNEHTKRYWSITRYSSNYLKLQYNEEDIWWQNGGWKTHKVIKFLGYHKHIGYHKIQETKYTTINGKNYKNIKVITTSRSPYSQCKAENPYDSFDYIS